MSNYKVTDAVAKQTASIDAVLPRFVVDNHPKFVSFVKHYFNWSATEGPKAALNYMKINHDIDLAIESMLPSYRRLLLHNFPDKLEAEFRHFTKFIKHFYDVKGTPESYRILFRALFNADVTVRSPYAQCLIPSAAEWSVNPSIIVEYAGNPFELEGLFFTGKLSGATFLVDQVTIENNTICLRVANVRGNIAPNDIFSSADVEVKILAQYSIEHIESNQSFFDNDVIKLQNGVVLQVDKIHYGAIEDITIDDGGTGYEVGEQFRTKSSGRGTGFLGEVASIGLSGEITSIVIHRTGFGFDNIDVQFVFENSEGADAVLLPVWDSSFRKIHALSVVNNRVKRLPGTIEVALDDGTVITLGDAAQSISKAWRVMKGAPSTATAHLHDSDYFQEFSYDLKTTANASKHRDSIKALLGVAGLKMFVTRIVCE